MIAILSDEPLAPSHKLGHFARGIMTSSSTRHGIQHSFTLH
jgi:hypothetical protein